MKPAAGASVTLNLVVALLLLGFAGSLLLSFRSEGQAVRLRKAYLVNEQEKQPQVGEAPDANGDYDADAAMAAGADLAVYPPKEAEVVAREAEVREKQLEALQSRCEGQLPLMLVTAERPDGCKTQKGCQIIMRSYKNKVDYCNLQGCKVWYSLETWEEALPGTWARYPLLRSLMDSNPNVPWFMWMDADAVITDMSFSPPLAEYERRGKKFVLTGYEDQLFGDEANWTGLNAGIFLIRNCAWSKAFLDKWMAFGTPDDPDALRLLLNREMPNRPEFWKGDDQSSLVHMLREFRHHSPEDDAAVLLETRYGLHGYWIYIVPELEKMQALGNTAQHRWPFITHFVGCKLCSGEYASSSVAECFHSFHRAFTFADDQILGLAKMRHVRLADKRVVSKP